MINKQEIISLEQQYLLQTYKRPDFLLERGDGVWLYDTDGRKYLDAGSGIAVVALGHQNEIVTEALQRGVRELLYVSNLYHTAPNALLARDLCRASFADRVYFCNSGAEANEGALKFARKYAKINGNGNGNGIVAFDGSFHGRTMGALSVTSREKYRTPFEPLLEGVTFAKFNDLENASQAITKNICAVIVEPVQGEGGVTPADPEFLAGLRSLCDETGAVLIFDEVQCGLGRTGTLWAYEGYDVMPDIMTLSKPMAGGVPIGAVLLTQNVADTIEVGDHGSTFAGAPLACTVARAVLSHINRPQFLADVQAKGEYLGGKLNEIVTQSKFITGMRGKGMMYGLISTIPAAEIMIEARNHNLIILVSGENIVRLLPPLTITKDEIDILAEQLLATLEAVG